MRQEEGPKLALGCAGAMVVLAGLAFAATRPNNIVSGLALLVIGVFIVATHQTIADVHGHLIATVVEPGILLRGFGC